jgi:hypothetical protein
MREYTVFTGTRVIITAENEADMQSKLSQGIWEEREVDSIVEHVGPELESDTFDPKEIADGDLLDMIHELVSETEMPEYQIIGEIKRLLKEALTY